MRNHIGWQRKARPSKTPHRKTQHCNVRHCKAWTRTARESHGVAPGRMAQARMAQKRKVLTHIARTRSVQDILQQALTPHKMRQRVRRNRDEHACMERNRTTRKCD